MQRELPESMLRRKAMENKRPKKYKLTPSFDLQGRAKRWVQRVFIAPSLWTHRKLARSKHRVFQPQKAV